MRTLYTTLFGLILITLSAILKPSGVSSFVPYSGEEGSVYLPAVFKLWNCLDKEQILFERLDNTYQIITMNLDGSCQTKLTNFPGNSLGYNRFPSWSPNGSKIAYDAYTTDTTTDIFIMDADGVIKLISPTPRRSWNGTPLGHQMENKSLLLIHLMVIFIV